MTGRRWTTRILVAAFLALAAGCAPVPHRGSPPIAQAPPSPRSVASPESAPRSASPVIRGQDGNPWEGYARERGPEGRHYRGEPVTSPYRRPASASSPSATTSTAPGQPTYRTAPASTTTAPAPTATYQPPVTTYQPPATGGIEPLPPPGESVPPGNATLGYPRPPEEVVPPDRVADLEVLLRETQTGRFMFGVGVSSSSGLTGQISVEERNFDITRFPRSFEEIFNGTAFRGGGQGLRIEALPGSEVQRYSVRFSEPYLFDTRVSMSVNGYYFDRLFFDYDEERIGGTLSFGYRLSPDVSVSTRLRAEQIDISNLRVAGVPELERVRGQSELYSGRVSLTRDTRDLPFSPTSGSYFEISYQQAFGTFEFPRADLDYRTYFLLHERPDQSGRHTLSYSFRLGVSGSDTPVFENYFAGGFSTIRGFNFRGASPVSGGAIVGGRFQFLGSVQYQMPITADDMLKAVAFVDFGTVEQDIKLDSDTYRVAPGFGLRISVPAMGPAPIALDFAFPIAKADFDEEQIFSFFVGFGRN